MSPARLHRDRPTEQCAVTVGLDHVVLGHPAEGRHARVGDDEGVAAALVPADEPFAHPEIAGESDFAGGADPRRVVARARSLP